MHITQTINAKARSKDRKGQSINRPHQISVTHLIHHKPNHKPQTVNPLHPLRLGQPHLLPAPLVLQGTTPWLAPRSASSALEAHTRRPELLSARFVLPAHIRLCWVPLHLQLASAAVEALTLCIKARLDAAYAP